MVLFGPLLASLSLYFSLSKIHAHTLSPSLPVYVCSRVCACVCYVCAHARVPVCVYPRPFPLCSAGTPSAEVETRYPQYRSHPPLAVPHWSWSQDASTPSGVEYPKKGRRNIENIMKNGRTTWKNVIKRLSDNIEKYHEQRTS